MQSTPNNAILNNSKITSFDLRLGRPNPKLGILFSHITKKFTFAEPYAVREESQSERDKKQ